MIYDSDHMSSKRSNILNLDISNRVKIAAKCISIAVENLRVLKLKDQSGEIMVLQCNQFDIQYVLSNFKGIFAEKLTCYFSKKVPVENYLYTYMF